MLVTARKKENLQVSMEAGGHSLLADEPVSSGGEDKGPNPYALLLASLAACKVMTVQLYAQRKGWPLEDVRISLSTHKVHAEDCEDCDSDPGAKVDIIEAKIAFEGELDEAQISRLTEISERCPVHRSLTSETVIRTEQVAITSLS
jgi:putative redox protein